MIIENPEPRKQAKSQTARRHRFKPHNKPYTLYGCEMCGFETNEIAGKRYRDGDVVQWCKNCGASDDHIVEIPRVKPKRKRKTPTFNGLKDLLRL